MSKFTCSEHSVCTALYVHRKNTALEINPKAIILNICIFHLLSKAMLSILCDNIVISGGRVIWPCFMYVLFLVEKYWT